MTAKPIPNDIDLGVVLAGGHDFPADLAVGPYNVVDRRRVRRVYGLDVLVVEEAAADFDVLVRFFQRVRLQPGRSKGILRIDL